MYYPYIRAKQFELLAIKGLLPIISDKKDKISPIIEPVRDSSTLKNILKSLKENDINFNFIINPLVGDLNENTEEILSILESELGNYNNYQIGILVENVNGDYYEEIINKLKGFSLNYIGYTLIHTAVIRDIADKLKFFNDKPIINNVINLTKTNSDRRYNRKFDNTTQVSLDDYFQSQTRNADYLNIGTSTFSNDFSYYKSEGFKGFGDYLTIGDNYSEGGFRPYAVAIHISFIDENKELVVKHFVSDSNGDPSDVAGKFAEANYKLNLWLKENSISTTEGLKEFQELYKTKHFPGLGVLKKLSIMNHIELVIKNI